MAPFSKCLPANSTVNNTPNPCLRTLTEKVDSFSRAVQTLCTKLDEQSKGARPETSQAAAPQKEGRTKKHRKEQACQYNTLGTRVTLSNEAPLRPGGRLDPQIRGRGPKRLNSRHSC
ncbi:hypothetical protein Nepgr_008957 [Nepenthes gracilis]|uniref:Uncharacterized protein n=1 Tax=Nepenthes gracilis TaxID=150966 RepID=A0AAD3S9X1_NEPGR|nr:hypothetical protein Nepgr_008957 [Nepenthes gracilis]